MKKIEFLPGDIVILKSGGPTMTVSSIVANGRVDCEYFWGFGVYSQKFRETSLRKVSEPRFRTIRTLMERLYNRVSSRKPSA